MRSNSAVDLVAGGVVSASRPHQVFQLAFDFGVHGAAGQFEAKRFVGEGLILADSLLDSAGRRRCPRHKSTAERHPLDLHAVVGAKL